MTAVAVTPRSSPPTADTILKGAAGLWLAVALLGQWFFFYYILTFYGPSTASGNFAAWAKNGMLIKGYVAGDTAGNLAFAAHALLAAVIAFGGGLQLIPQMRARFPRFHRWNGRAFLVTAISLSVSGLYLIWVRHTNNSLVGAIAITGNAVLILGFAALAWRTAVARNFVAHRRWAMRLYLVSNAQWFTRVGFMAWVMAHGGKPVHMHAFFGVLEWACYLLPLAVLEIYLRARDGAGPVGKLAAAGLIGVMTLVMAGGALGYSMLSVKIINGQLTHM
jgi:hypothetical protein